MTALELGIRLPLPCYEIRTCESPHFQKGSDLPFSSGLVQQITVFDTFDAVVDSMIDGLYRVCVGRALFSQKCVGPSGFLLTIFLPI